MRLPIVCYLYDEETGVYLNRSVEAIPDPKVRGLYNIPINATLEAPPSTPDPHRQVAVFRDNEWHIERKGSVPMTSEPVATKQASKQVQANEDEINQRR